MPAVLYLKPGHEKPLQRRHPWIFSGAVERMEGEASGPEPGEIGECRSSAGAFLARGTIHPEARIAFRAYSFDPDLAVDGELIRARIAESIARRPPLIPGGTNAYRLVYAEADGLPGLVVDRFGSVLVCEITTAGMLRFREEVVRALESELSPRAVYLRTPRRPALAEGIPQASRLLAGEMPDQPAPFSENGISFSADIAEGQKTGFYLDQRDSRLLVRRHAAGRRVLDAYAYSGGFGVSAALGGAESVTCVERSKPAVKMARRHFDLNGVPVERTRLVEDDVPSFLRDEGNGPFDLIVLDPPPLAAGRSSLPRAARAYKDINLFAFKRLAPGGQLLTFSCSQSVDADLLGKIIFGAALDAGVGARVLHRLGQPFDHPVSVYHPEGEYLRGLLLQVD